MALFSKEPAEKKAFWKAFDAARSKPGETTFPGLEKACAAWPISPDFSPTPAPGKRRTAGYFPSALGIVKMPYMRVLLILR